MNCNLMECLPLMIIKHQYQRNPTRRLNPTPPLIIINYPTQRIWMTKLHRCASLWIHWTRAAAFSQLGCGKIWRKWSCPPNLLNDFVYWIVYYYLYQTMTSLSLTKERGYLRTSSLINWRRHLLSQDVRDVTRGRGKWIISIIMSSIFCKFHYKKKR